MRLSKLKLAGFKTFVDPTTVLTPGNLVGVVGPNGCGKSNIIDAVRWVLGESRASALRGESMQDVIFNGSMTRKPVSRASVELVFDNNEGKAAGQWSRYAEISVKRVLDRSGESTYLINNVHVRRKDVIDLFLGTGLGPRAYAIIEQGMISRIIEARPEEIRGFLEEAAGVTKYRERRKETEGRLRDARDNLVRIDDIRAELGERIERLREQAAVAARYRELNAAHVQRQQLLWLLKRNEARVEHGRLHDEVNQLSTRLEADSERLVTLEAAVEQAREAHFAATEATHHAQSELFAASAEVSRLESELKHLQDTYQRLLNRLAELEREHGHWHARQSALNIDQARWSDLLEHAGLRVEQAQARHDEAAQRLPELEAARRGADATVAATRRELAQTEQLLRVAEANHASATRALDNLGQRRARLEADRDGIAGPDPVLLEERGSRVEALQDVLADRQGQLADAQSRFTDAQAALKAALADERRVQQESSALRARHDALVQLQAGVQSRGQLGEWLKRHGLSDLAPLWRGIRVEPGWERAVAATLREHLAALTGDTGSAVAALLNQAPPDTVSLALPALAEAEATATIVPPQGAAHLGDRITVLDPGVSAIVAECVRGCFTVEALEPWMERRTELAGGCRVVDMQGTIMGRHALSHYAPDNRTDGVIERQREIEALSEQRTEMDARVGHAHAALQTAEATAGALQELIGNLRREVQETQQQLHAEQVELLKLSQAHQRAVEKREQIRHDLDDLVHQESTEREHQLRAEMERERNAELDTLQREQVDAAQQVLDERSRELQEVRVLEQNTARELQEARFSERECKGKLEEAARNLQLAAEQLQRIATETSTREQELDASDSSRSQAALHEALSLRERREAALHTCRDTQEQAAAHLKQTEELRLRTEQEAAPLRERIGGLRLALQAAELAITQFAERLAEVGADEAALAPLLTGNLRETSLQRDVARLARELAELGQVNLAALDELQGAEQRLGYLDDQCTDLTTAIETLEDAIRRIDRETRDQLQDTYNTVSAHLNTLFPLLFGGGQARLVLTGDEILDAGIQIVAQPPGKKNTSIHLLSGGEKALTAIALVFSMFQLNPAPFCMLDEVDAPLDDANTERYCQMVKRMSAQTQFIFISHSKVTMEIARQLIGVTMQEQGVSRVVEVDIEEALRMAETAAA